MSTDDANKARRDELNEKLEKLSKTLLVLCPARGRETNPARKNEQDSEIEEVMQKQDGCLNELVDLDSRSLEEALLYLNYDDQALRFQSFLEHEKRVGALVIHGKLDYGQGLLLQRFLQRVALTTELLPIDVGERIRQNDVNGIWTRIAAWVKAPTAPPKIDTIIEGLLKKLKTQNVVLVFRHVENAPKEFLQQVINEFWLQMATRIGDSGLKSGRHLLMFLDDRKGNVVAWITCGDPSNPDWKPCIPVELPETKALTVDDVERWIRRSLDSLPPSLANRVTKMDYRGLADCILEKTGGIPAQVLLRIYQLCGDEYTDEFYKRVDKWLK